MNRILMFIMFFVFFIGTYFGMNYYVFYRLSTIFALKRNALFYVLIALSTFIYPLVTILGKNFYNMFTRILNVFAGTYMGFLFLLFFAFLVFELLRFIPGINIKTTGMIIIGLVLLLTAYSIFNGFSLITEEINLEMNNLEENVRFVQLSDIHTGSIRNSHYLNKIVEKTNSLNPDFVVITGDLIDGSAKLRDDMFDELNNIRTPIFFIMGNHETYEGIINVIKTLNNNDIEILRNNKTEINGIELVGIDYSENRDYLNDSLSEIDLDSSKPSILLYHIPKEMEVAEKKGFDLMLSGHTHKGQIFPFNLFVRLEFKYISGLHKIGNMNLYINQGTGMWGPPMRLGSKNEITVFNLKPVKN